MTAPRGWSNAARYRAGMTTTSSDPCWGCGVVGCTDCGPSPDAEPTPTGTDVTDETDQPDERDKPCQ